MGKLAPFLIVLAALVYSAAAISSKSLVGQVITIDRFDYFSDRSSTLFLNKKRTQEAARLYCESYYGKLAPVLSFKAYVRLLDKIVNGVYWIDGYESNDVNRFSFYNNCTSDTENINMGNANLVVGGKNCLVLVKPTPTQQHRIEPVPCSTTRARVLCARENSVCPSP
ncbi:hypothetical protein Ocin01_18631 [Orchesella cincta]|uniref:C-type lectin domain-containing protein n=1 Tax=Orchesella cincta TaxID=48709 RepID=A0A1D2M4Z1_ORCCI|nr:hypothetical protein Ocin01_18631 [Orchesella cincta]